MGARKGPFGRYRELWREREDLFAVTATTVIVSLGHGVVLPLLPLFARSFEVSIAAVGAVLSVSPIARLALNTPLGAYADRFGRRVFMVAGRW